ncbi:MAG: hypothetical protein JNJ53_06785 [Rhizobiales bacterium]|nr:hypothetical protein [Hyphomicrobiales bacterium]
MSKLMIMLGILAVAIGVAVGVLGYVAPGQMQVAGLTAEVAALFLMSGILAVGLGGVIGALNDQRKTFHDLAETLVARTDRSAERFARVATPPATPEPPPPPPKQAPAAKPEVLATPEPAPAPEPEPDLEQKPLIFTGTVRSLDQARERAGLKPVDQPAAETRITTRETIIAIEKAKSDLETALGSPPPPPPPDTPAAVEPPPKETVLVAEIETEFDVVPAEGEEEQLYVMEEKLIRGRPARVLSDGTVEAETDEGWMRFENLEHLEEYLDAMSPAKG